MPDMKKIKAHPGFMPFGYVNTSVNKNTETQSKVDRERSDKEKSSDSKK